MMLFQPTQFKNGPSWCPHFLRQSLSPHYHRIRSTVQSHTSSHASFWLPRPAHPNMSFSAVSLSRPDLLKSVPVSWARMRKERDWVVPVRGCQSSVSSISLFLLRSLGIKQGMLSTLRPCLCTHTEQQHTAAAVNKIPSNNYQSHQTRHQANFPIEDMLNTSCNTS